MRRFWIYAVLTVCLGFFSGIAHAGTCPSGTNYLNLTNPSANGYVGSVTLGSGNATNSAITTCFYSDPVAGLDTNSGADETHPFKYVKGMPNCASNCSLVTTSSTTGWIIKGGGTYHVNSGSPLIGGQWSIPAFGYVGIDPTWFTGGSFTRPLINIDNPQSTSIVASCTYEGTNTTTVSVAANTVFDGIEIVGMCSTDVSGAGNGGTMISGSGGSIIERTFEHAWTESTASTDDRLFATGGSGSNRYLFITIDGSDSSLGTACTSAGCVAGCWNGSPTTPGTYATGWAMVDCDDVEYSIVRHASQGCEANTIHIWHDNDMEFIFEPAFGTPCCRHGNGLEPLAMNSTTTAQVYNNVFCYINDGQNTNLNGTTMYIYNNVWCEDGHFPPDPNGLFIEPFSNNSAQLLTAFIYNNTFDSTVAASVRSGSTSSGSPITFANNHIIGRTSPIGNLFTCSNCTTTDSGGETFMPTATATTQGYVIGNYFAPTLGTNTTVHAGINESSSCGGNFVALCSSIGGVSEGSGFGGLVPIYPRVTINARGTTFDSGAYQFSASLSFTVSPNTVPSHHTNSITLTIAGTGLTPSATFTISGVTGASLSSCTNTATSGSCLLTTGSGTGAATITDTTDSVSTTISILTAGLSVSPSSGNTSTTPTVTLTCTGSPAPCLWTTETAAGLFTLSGGTGSSIGTPTVTSNTLATAVLTTGTTTATETITDTSTTATATFVVSGPVLTVIVTGNGSVSDSLGGIVSCTGTCTHTYTSGANDTLTATPTAGFILSGWGGACSGSSSTCNITISSNTTVTATFGKNQYIYGGGAGSGPFTIGPNFTQNFPPTSGPDNYYCSATNQPINGLSGFDDVAQGPQTCMNTAVVNTPSPSGFYQHGGNYTAISCSDINNIAAGTGGFTQITPGETLLISHTLLATNCNISWSAGGTVGNWITIETDDIGAIPAEGTRITPCFAGISSVTGLPSYPSHNSGCTQVVPILQLAHSTGAGGLAGLKLLTGAQYLRFVGIDFARDGGAWAFATQPTTATPNIYSRTCNATNCVSQVGVGDGTTQGSITSTHQSLSSNSSGVNVQAGAAFTSQVAVAQTLYHFAPGNFTVASVVDDTDFTYNETYAQARIGGGTISTISRTTGCLVTGTYTYSQNISPAPTVGLTIFVAGVTDTSFNMTSGSVALTAVTVGSGSLTFGYTQAGGSCTASTSSGGELIAIGSPTPNVCNSYANNNCNGIVGNDAVQDVMMSMAAGVNNIIFDRIMIEGDTYSETSKGLVLGDTDHIALIDSFCWNLQSYITIGEASDEHCISGAVQTNTDANAGTYKVVDNFFSTSNQGFLFGGGPQGFLLTQVTLTPGGSAFITGICAVTCGIPSGTTTQFMAGSTLWPGGAVSEGINQNQTVTCCTTTTVTNDTFTFPIASSITCPSSCTDTSIDMTIGGYLPTGWEIRRNWKYTPLIFNPLDPSYNGGGPLPTGGLPFTTKNCNEFKNGSYVLMEGNVCSNSWNTVDQLGASLLVTPKDQSNIAPSAQITNLIYRYNRTSNTNVGLGVSNAIATTGGTAYQGNTMVFHDNVIAELGSPTLTCAYVYLNLTANAVSCYSSVPQQTQAIRSGSPGATSSTPNFIQGNVHFIHNDFLSQNQSAVLLTGGPQTNPSGQYGMVFKDSILGNGNLTPPIGNAGGAGTVSGFVSVTGAGLTVTWVSGGQFLCTTIWGQGTQIAINSINYVIAVCTDNTDIVLQTPAPLSANVKYSVSGSCTGICTGAGNTPSCIINACWNNPVWNYNIVYGFSAPSQTWPGNHTQTYANASSISFTNYNSSVPSTSNNWAAQFALICPTSTGCNAADDGSNIGANIPNVTGYTQNVDVLQ